MEKIKFTLQIAVLILAFPVWFLAEMKKADKVLQSNRRHNVEAIGIQKVIVKHNAPKLTGSELVLIPFAEYMIVNN